MTPQADAQARSRRRVVVIVGMDHHPFERLITWFNDWISHNPQLRVGSFVQGGSTVARPACEGSAFLDVTRLASLLDAADVIVCHGGPASISEAWARGRKPIVVPRLARLGEHVDDHQAEFCAKAAELGRIALAGTLADFTALLDDAVSDPCRFRTTSSSSDADLAVVRLGGLVEELVSRRGRQPLPGRSFWRRRNPAPVPGGLTGSGGLSAVRPTEDTNWRPDRAAVDAGLATVFNEERE